MSNSSTNTLGKYQIIREIARSNDIVYEAIDPSINRRIALKELCMPPNLQGAQRRERIERFWREGRAAGKLSHPNIVTIFEVGKEGDRHFIAMEFLEGQNLRDRLQVGGPLPLKDITHFGLQLCSALSYAHQNGVVHRDIKPENVQILPGNHVKLTDFGIARLMGEPSITQDGQVFGTPSYMSPEQVSGKFIDARTDIYSLGVLLYEMAAGHKPFTGDSVVTITYNIMNMEPTPPPGAPPYLVGIIRKAMAKDPDMRYSSVDELSRDLQEERSSDAFAFPMQDSSAPSPFGGAAPQQQQQGPVTPYGTSVPPSWSGSVPTSSPDPFLQSIPVPAPSQPSAPPEPILSSETRNFLGIFLVVAGLVGMLIFAIWAINLAYNSYRTAATADVAAKYYTQGQKLYNRGQIDAAVEQWRNAVRVSPKSKVAKNARESIYNVSIGLARQSYDARNVVQLQEYAKNLIEAQPERPEGHFYLASAYQFQFDEEKAKQEYILAVQYGGNDEYAQAARRNLASLYLIEGDKHAASGQIEAAVASYENVRKYGDADAMQVADERINRMR